jgi:hypothetical protein
MRTFAVMVLLVLLASSIPIPTAAAPSVPQDVEVYTEGFMTYTAKDYTEHAQWNIWAQSLRLAFIDGMTQEQPAMGMDGNGNVVVVWKAERDGGSDIYAQKLDSNGNRLWANDVRVNSEGGTVYQYASVAVAVDASGNAVAVWDNRTSDWDIYAQRLDGSGNRLWSDDLRVNSDSGTASQVYPAVAIDGDGNAAVVWQDGRNGDADIYAQKLDGSGNRMWTTDVRVNFDSGTTSQMAPAIAVDGMRNLSVAWHDSRNGDPDIYAQRLASSGSRLWMNDVRVNSDDGTTGQTYPAVSVDGRGDARVVWVDYRFGKPDLGGKAYIYAQKLNSTGDKLWAGDIRVNSGSETDDPWHPAVAVDDGGHAVVTWMEDRGDDYDICAQKLGSSGNRLWVTDVRVNSDSGTADQRYPGVTVDESGHAVVVWHDRRTGDPDICLQKLDEDGSKLWATDIRVNSGNGAAFQTYPDLATDGGGNAVITWLDDRNDEIDVYAQKIDSGGNRLWVADVRVNSDGEVADYQSPAVAVDGDGNAIAVWVDYRNGDADIYAQKLDGSGNRLWATDLRVNSDSGTASQGYPTVAVNEDGNAVVVWHDQRNGDADIYAQKLDGNGSKMWTNDVRINSDSGTENQWVPAVAMDRNGNAVVVWNDHRNVGNGDIYVQKLDGGGNKVWMSDVYVSSDGGIAGQDNPDVGLDGTGNPVVAWRDYRNRDADIYAQRLDASGNRLWMSDVRINSGADGESQWLPAVAVDRDGNSIVAWQHYLIGDADIYAQKLDRNGNKLWGPDVRIDSDSGTAFQYSPSVAVDEAGNAVVVWTDHRDGNADIYAQRMDAYGNKLWTSDAQVVYPDQFYFPTGTAQSRTVDTVTATIRSATLTADYQANGGEVQFYLTNDGGTHWTAATVGAATVFTITGSDLRWRAVLTADPLWPRTPMVNSLRIEYSTQVPYADDYEEDDTCAQAQPIQVGGTAQTHTFHQAGDADWVWFDVISGTTYIVETYNLGTRANTVAEMYPTCDAPPAGTGRSFGNGYTFSFTADQTGRFYTKVYNHTPSVYGQDTDYTLSVRSVHPNAVAIVVAGHDSGNTHQDNILYAADRAYRVFLNAGPGKANVRYLAPLANHDADGDGANDVAGLSTPANVRDAVQDWARERGVALGVPLYVYLVDHGLVDRFKADGDALASHVTAADLNLWLSNLEATTGADNVNVILDACYSGSFIDETALGPATISGRNRVVIASTTSDWQAYGPPGGEGLYFSNAFFSGLENEQSLWASYAGARQAVESQGLLQQPWLDDNGDQQADSRDGALASGRALRRVAMGGRSPQIEWLSASGGVVRVKVADDSAWVGVKVEVFAPSYVPPAPDGSGTTRIVDVPVVTLADLDSDGVYEGTYAFLERGVYRLVAHAEDAEGNLALPQGVQVCTGCVYLPLVLR